jgi:hypothetical protein
MTILDPCCGVTVLIYREAAWFFAQAFLALTTAGIVLAMFGVLAWRIHRRAR